jgi:acetyl esterase/lipase
MRASTLLVLVLAAVSVRSGQPATQPPPIPLWPGGAPGARGESPEDAPSIQLYQPPAGKASGAAIVVCPGGGYARLAPHEGHDVARWLNGLGVTAVVLKYRLGPRYQHPAMMQDVLRAIRLVRARSAEWKLDPDRVGVMGFSAGGHLASTAATHFDAGDSLAKDPIERIKSRPDLAILCYPVITMRDPHAHPGSRKNLLGDPPAPERINELSNEARVNAATPPTFLFHTADDAAVPVENSMLFAAALRRAGVPHELHVFEHGRHGVGLAQNDPVLSLWPKLLENWLRARGFLAPGRVSDAGAPKPRDPDIRQLLDEVRNAPPELAAQAMIALALHPDVDDSWKAEILEEAFVFASKAAHPLRRRDLEKFHRETRSGYRARAYNLELDRLSLQTSILEYLVELKPAVALELWNRMPPLELAPLTCRDTLVYDVGVYYRFLPGFAHKALSKTQIQNEEHTRMIESQLRQLRSAAEIVPAIEAMREFKPNREQFDSLLKAFSRGLETIEPDDRSFQHEAGSATTSVITMAEESRRRDLTPGHLIEAHRDLIVRQLSGSRCIDNVYLRGRPAPPPGFIAAFNQILLAYKPTLQITGESIRPIRIEGEPEYHAYWQTRPAQSLFRGLHRLGFGGGNEAARYTAAFNYRPAWLPEQGVEMPRRGRRQPADESKPNPVPPQLLPIKERQTLQWQQQLAAYLRELSEWKPEHEATEADYFHQKCRLYFGLIEVTPDGGLFDRLLGEYSVHLSVNRFNREYFTDWFLHVTDLVRRSRTMDRVESVKLIEALRAADDPMLRLYIKLIPYYEIAAKPLAARQPAPRSPDAQ